MAQADGVVANGTGSAVRADINGQLAALFTNHSGSTEPATTFAFQTWADTNTNTLKLRNSSNDGWVQLARLDGQFDAKTFNSNVTLNAQSDLRFADSDSSNWVAFQAPATVASNVTWTLPSADGTADQALVTDGSGTLSWADSGGSDNITEGNTSAEVVDTGSDGHFKVVTEGTEALRVDASRRLLVGTSTAATTGTAQYSRFQIQGDTDFDRATMALRCAAAGSSITQNVAIGEILFTDTTGGPFASIYCAADGAAGNNDYPGSLRFQTTPNGTYTPQERMRIAQNGDFGFFGTNPSTEVRGLTSGHGLRFLNNSYKESAFPNGGEWYFNNTSSTGARYFIFFRTQGITRGTITSDGSTTSYNTSSDYRLKENVVPLTGAADRLNQLQVRRFNFIEDPDRTVDGFIAHEAQAVVPEAVTGTHNEVEVWQEHETLPDGVSVGDNKLDEDGNTIPVYQGIDQSKLVPLLTAALQEALAKIETLETRLTALEGGA